MTETKIETGARYRSNLRGEVDSAALYRALADAEENPQLAEVYRRLAAVEEAHAEFWRKELARVGARLPALRAGWRTRFLIRLAHWFGPTFVLPTVVSLERADVSRYDAQPEATASGLPSAERSHSRVVTAVLENAPSGAIGPALAKLEGRHHGVGGGNALRAAVLGANDGLVSNLSLVMGVIGAAVSEHTILVTGLAGLVAGASSMAMGEWLSVTNSRELFESQVRTEADELEHNPAEEQEELALIYQAKGLSQDEARTLARRLFADRKSALDTLVREELGLDPDELGGSPYVAAVTSFGLFSVGAIFPVLPFFFLSGLPAVAASLGLAGLALAVIGVATSIFTGRSAAFSALRQLVIGYGAAAITFGIGKLVGVSLGG
ncbi:MAG TPA: VIT1/CCC1 transporter family protein [Stellaceae bacterium]|nr:VIT1/CCC1 transporter family protein [Stellaceae bacterium]